ncbi:MAG: AAA family ATPase [Nocardioidaceae bacterium]
MDAPLALYRRYRPETFAEVIGQAHIAEPLRHALANNRFHHAYLFSGPRGCGKTTSARILARTLNCEKAPIADPCGECQSCRDLATRRARQHGRHRDRRGEPRRCRRCPRPA